MLRTDSSVNCVDCDTFGRLQESLVFPAQLNKNGGFAGTWDVGFVVLGLSSNYLLLLLFEKSSQLVVIDPLHGFKLHHLSNQPRQLLSHFVPYLVLQYIAQGDSSMKMVPGHLVGVDACHCVYQHESSTVYVLLSALGIARSAALGEEVVEFVGEGQGVSLAVEVLSRLGQGYRGAGNRARRGSCASSSCRRS